MPQTMVVVYDDRHYNNFSDQLSNTSMKIWRFFLTQQRHKNGIGLFHLILKFAPDIVVMLPVLIFEIAFIKHKIFVVFWRIKNKTAYMLFTIIYEVCFVYN